MRDILIATFTKLLPRLLLPLLLLTLTFASIPRHAGAAAAGARELLAPLSQGADKPTQRFVSSLIGITAGAIAGGDRGAEIGYAVALSAEANNRQLHQKEIAWLEDPKHVRAFADYYRAYTGKTLDFEEAQRLLARGGISLVDRSYHDTIGQNDPVQEARDFIKENYKDTSVLFYHDDKGNLVMTHGFDPTQSEYEDRYANLEGFYQNREFYQNYLDFSTGDHGSLSDYAQGAIEPLAELGIAIKSHPTETLQAMAAGFLDPIGSGYAYGEYVATEEAKAQLDTLLGDDASAARHRGGAYSGIVAAVATKGALKGTKLVGKHLDSAVDGIEIPKVSPLDGSETGNIPIKVITIDGDRYPESAQHIYDAQQAGHPNILTIDREGATRNRRDSLKGTKTIEGLDRDEYPPAMFEEGGAGASVRYINPSDNRGAGSCIGAGCRELDNGDKIILDTTISN